jgi:hypothetical protein
VALQQADVADCELPPVDRGFQAMAGYGLEAGRLIEL